MHLVQTPNTPPATDDPTGSQQTEYRKHVTNLARIADNGACAITALVDAEEGDLYVALAGDCRAVAGWEKDGVWRCDVLTEDQMGENPREVDRYVKCPSSRLRFISKRRAN